MKAKNLKQWTKQKSIKPYEKLESAATTWTVILVNRTLETHSSKPSTALTSKNCQPDQWTTTSLKKEVQNRRQVETIRNLTAYRLIWMEVKTKWKYFPKRILVFCMLMLPRINIQLKLKAFQVHRERPTEQVEREKALAGLMNRSFIWVSYFCFYISFLFSL